MKPTEAPAELRRRRLAAGIQLIDMAAHLGISAPYLHDLEHGNRRLSPEHRLLYSLGLKLLAPSTAGVSSKS